MSIPNISEAPRRPIRVGGKRGDTTQGLTIQCPAPYAEGYTLRENEAAALNSLLSENLRNIFSRRLADMIKKTGVSCAAELNADEVQAAFDELAATYDFGQRRTREPVDPVEAKALALAKDAVRRVIRENGGKVSDYTKEEIEAAAKDAVETNPDFRAMAQKMIEQQQALAASIPMPGAE